MRSEGGGTISGDHRQFDPGGPLRIVVNLLACDLHVRLALIASVEVAIPAGEAAVAHVYAQAMPGKEHIACRPQVDRDLPATVGAIANAHDAVADVD
jgi:hypothetical protein